MERDNICKFSDIRSSDLICTAFVYENTSAQQKKTYTDRYILGFVDGGEGILTQRGMEFKIKKGDAFFIDKDSEFSITGADGLAYFYISFFGRRADELVRRFVLSASYCVFDISESYEELSLFALSCLKRANEENTDILSECGLLYLLTYLKVEKSKSPDLLSAMIALSSKNFSDPSFSLGALAEMMKYDSKYLSFYFKKHQRIGYSEYLRDLRIRHAVFLIEQGLTSVKNIALLSGFTDALYFSKVFKKEIGKTPKEYIAEAQASSNIAEKEEVN